LLFHGLVLEPVGLKYRPDIEIMRFTDQLFFVDDRDRRKSVKSSGCNYTFYGGPSMDSTEPLCIRSLMAALVILFLFGLEKATAQESIRPSLAGSLSAESRRPIIDTGQYNLKLGPALVGMTAGLDLEYNDNITLSDTGRKSDLIVVPSLNANVLWQLSEYNSLRLDLGVGYVKYVENSQFDSTSLTITPNSQLAFDIYVGDFRFTIFDQLSIQQNPVNEINLSRVARFERLQNAAGVSATWDLNKVILFGGYTHYNFYSIDSQFDSLNQSEEQFFLSASLKLSDVLTIGVRSTFGTTVYSENFQNDSTDYSAGAFVETRLTRYLALSAEGGYQGAHFYGGGLNVDNSQLSSPYARLQIDHRLNRYWTEHLSVGYEAQLGFTTNFTELFYVHYDANWRMNSRMNVTFDAFYEHGTDSAGTVQVENIDRVGGGVSCGFAIGRKVTLNLGYQIIDRNSDLAGHSYYQNRVLLGIGYVF
jgi:hypothetical protein